MELNKLGEEIEQKRVNVIHLCPATDAHLQLPVAAHYWFADVLAVLVLKTDG